MIAIYPLQLPSIAVLCTGRLLKFCMSGMKSGFWAGKVMMYLHVPSIFCFISELVKLTISVRVIKTPCMYLR